MDKQETKREALLNRITALLEKTVDNGCTVEEAAAAAAKVQDLLLKYNLDMAEIIRAKGQKSEDMISKEGIPISIHKYTMKGWRINLMDYLAYFNFCKMLYRQGANVFILIGREVDVQVVEQLYHSISNQLEERCNKEAKAEEEVGVIASNWPAPDNTQTWKASFFQAAVEAIRKKLALEQAKAEQQAQQKAATNTTLFGVPILPAGYQNPVHALVVTTRKQAEQFATEKYQPKRTNTNKKYGTKVGNTWGSVAGEKAGREISGKLGIQKGKDDE